MICESIPGIRHAWLASSEACPDAKGGKLIISGEGDEGGFSSNQTTNHRKLCNNKHANMYV